MEGRNGSTDEGGRRPATAGRYTQIKRAKGIPLGELRRGGSGCYPRRGLNIRRKMTHLQPQIIPLVGLNIRRKMTHLQPQIIPLAGLNIRRFQITTCNNLSVYFCNFLTISERINANCPVNKLFEFCIKIKD